MPYKTLSFQFETLTRTKRELLHQAMEAYSDGLESVLRGLLERVEAEPAKTKNGYLKMMDREILAPLNEKGLEPFKDAIKLDAAMILTTYAGRRRRGKTVRYPSVRVYDGELDALVRREAFSKKEYGAALAKLRRLHPLFFCRYDRGRDYSLLRDTKSGRIYAKLYLYNRQNALLVHPGRGRELCYLPQETETLQSGKKQRYLLLPLRIGPWQERHLEDIRQGRAIPKSAALSEENGKFALHIRLWYEPAAPLACPNTMGVSRGIRDMLAYAVLDAQGRTIEEGTLRREDPQRRSRLHALSGEVLRLAERYRCRILMANLITRSDALSALAAPGMRVGEYNALVQMIAQKAPAYGLEAPVIVSGNGIFSRCPACQEMRRASVFQGNFICVKCGYSHALETLGAVNLAGALKRYGKKKIPVTVRQEQGRIVFCNSRWGIDFTCEETTEALDRFLRYAEEYVKAMAGGRNAREKSFVKQLEGRELSQCFQYIEV